jgi:Bacterial SH3 domain
MRGTALQFSRAHPVETGKEDLGWGVVGFGCTMWKLLTLLGLGMFLTLLIGGEDRGQMRQGLLEAPDPVPQVAAAAFDPDKITPGDAPAETVALATFVPVAPPAPAVPAVAPTEAQPVASSAPEPADPVVVAEPEPVQVRYVTASSINMREGPATTYAVIGRLTRNEAVSVVGEANDGWVRVRIEGDGAEGYVAARLLTDRAP